jgi:uncharacterized repeat protein (TIGR04138 family)
MQTVSFDEVVDKIVAKDARYHRDAYHFVREALDHTQKAIHKESREPKSKKERHVSGQQLLEGIREFALKQYGPMTITVFEEWGIRRCEDFGEIVFNLVDHGHGLFGRTETDSRDDFKGGYEFAEAFKKPFLPGQKISAPAESPSA